MLGSSRGMCAALHLTAAVLAHMASSGHLVLQRVPVCFAAQWQEPSRQDFDPCTAVLISLKLFQLARTPVAMEPGQRWLCAQPAQALVSPIGRAERKERATCSTECLFRKLMVEMTGKGLQRAETTLQCKELPALATQAIDSDSAQQQRESSATRIL